MGEAWEWGGASDEGGGGVGGGEEERGGGGEGNGGEEGACAGGGDEGIAGARGGGGDEEVRWRRGGRREACYVGMLFFDLGFGFKFIWGWFGLVYCCREWIYFCVMEWC